MATIVAQATGNWSAGATWTGGTKPGVGDIAQTGAYTVTIDEDVTCAQLEPTSTGYFLVNATRTITANLVVNHTLAFTGGLRCEHMSGSTVTLNGSITVPSGTSNVRGLHNTNTGAVVIVGNVTGPVAAGVSIYNASSGAITITGNVTGGSAGTASAIWTNATGAITITGNVTGGSAANTAYGVYNNSTAVVTVTGNATGGSAAVAVYNAAGGTVNASGTATGGSGVSVYGIHNQSTGTVTCKRAKGGASVNTPGLWGANSGGVTAWKELEFGTNGSAPVGGYTKMTVDQTTNQCVVKRADTGADLALAWDYPAVGNVQSGVTYWLGTLEGTLAGSDYPDEDDVRSGVTYSTFTGNMTLPAVSDVRDGETYGTGGSEYEGTLEVPAAGDVQESVQYGAAGSEYTGTLALPTEAQVESGVGYGADGTEFTGSLVGGSDWTSEEKAQIRLALGISGDTAETSGTGNLDMILTAVSALSTDEEIGVAVVAAMDADPPAVNVTLWNGETPDDLDDGKVQVTGGAGSGSTAYSNTVTDSDSNPLDGVEVWITSDSGGASTVASTTTDTLGAFTVYLDPGTYYLWLAKGGYNFPNPTTITVS